MSGISERSAFSQITGTRSGYLDRIRSASDFLFSVMSYVLKVSVGFDLMDSIDGLIRLMIRMERLDGSDLYFIRMDRMDG